MDCLELFHMGLRLGLDEERPALIENFRWVLVGLVAGVAIHPQKLWSGGIPAACIQHDSITSSGYELSRAHHALHSPASWTTGANIGWHSDDNRDYLRQRHFSAVCYLNTYEQDFRGGLFHFQDGQPATVIPTLGTVLIYSANEENVHSVDEVVDGERITMALWFTRDPAHDEDKKLIDQLMNVMPFLSKEQDKLSVFEVQQLRGENTGIPPQSSQEKERSEENADGDLMTTAIQFQSPPSDAILRDYFVPVPASTNMYWVGESETESKAGHNVGCEAADQGSDVRVKRLASLGFHCVGELDDLEIVLEKPLKLKYQDQDIAYEFVNILHALQVVQFDKWRRIVKLDSRNSSGNFMMWEPRHSPLQRPVLQMDIEETMVEPWEKYMRTRCTDLLNMLPAWRNTGSLFIRQHKEGV